LLNIGVPVSLPFSLAYVARGRKRLEMQGPRPRPTQAYSTYVEEVDGSVGS
jgi:hypothetical protein